MSGLLNLAPQFLPRYGMAPEWAGAVRPLAVLFTFVNLFVTWIFNADVESQGGDSTGVLVLMSSASIATAIISRERAGMVRETLLPGAVWWQWFSSIPQWP